MNYPNEKSLTSILVELAAYCYNITGEECSIKLTLPEEVVTKYTRIAFPKERIILANPDEEIISNIKTLHTGFGTVEFVKENNS